MTQTFWGSLTRSHASRGTGLNRLTMTPEALSFSRWPLRPIHVDREATRGIEARRIRLPLWWTTEFTFDCDSPAAGYIFAPARPNLLAESLRDSGWPIQVASTFSGTSLLRRILKTNRD
jgi:hypothetical protein